jgi:hypothetical protein
MKKISFWAKNHKWPSRIIIVLSIILLNAIGIEIGTLLNDLNVVIPLFIFFLLIILYLAGVIYYPSKAGKNRFTSAGFYRRQKTCDIILAASAFCMTIYISNDHFPGTKFFTGLYATTPTKLISPADSTAKSYKSIAAFSASLKGADGKSLKWKEKKKILKVQIRGIKKASDISTGGKIALIVLSVAVALGLLALIASLACDLSCSGSDGAAILVGVAGTALIIFLLVLAIKAITGKKKKLKQKEEQPDKVGLLKLKQKF